jgi:hypothetical protein
MKDLEPSFVPFDENKAFDEVAACLGGAALGVSLAGGLDIAESVKELSLGSGLMLGWRFRRVETMVSYERIEQWIENDATGANLALLPKSDFRLN